MMTTEPDYAVNIGCRSPDGTVVSFTWAITEDTATLLAEMLGPPMVEQLMDADLVARAAAVVADAPALSSLWMDGT